MPYRFRDNIDTFTKKLARFPHPSLSDTP